MPTETTTTHQHEHHCEPQNELDGFESHPWRPSWSKAHGWTMSDEVSSRALVIFFCMLCGEKLEEPSEVPPDA